MPAPLVGLATAVLPKVAEGVIGIFRRKADGKIEQAEAEAELRTLVAQAAAEVETTYRAELELQREVMVAELQQGDSYTKRARPSIIYAGLAVMIYNGVLRVLLGDLAQIVSHFTQQPFVLELTAVQLPAELWVAWGGVTGTYAIGRTREKIGAQPGRILQTIFGQPKEDHEAGAP